MPLPTIDASSPLPDHFLSQVATEGSDAPAYARNMATELVQLRAAVKAHWAAMIARGGPMDPAHSLLHSRLAVARP